MEIQNRLPKKTITFIKNFTEDVLLKKNGKIKSKNILSLEDIL